MKNIQFFFSKHHATDFMSHECIKSMEHVQSITTSTKNCCVPIGLPPLAALPWTVCLLIRSFLPGVLLICLILFEFGVEEPFRSPDGVGQMSGVKLFGLISGLRPFWPWSVLEFPGPGYEEASRWRFDASKDNFIPVWRSWRPRWIWEWIMKAISSSESLIDPAIEGFGTGGINPLGVATILF